MAQKFRESLQIGTKVNFHDKNFVITLNFRDSMLTRPFSARSYRGENLFSDWRIPDFKYLNSVTTVPDHQSNKTCRGLDSFWYPTSKTIVVRGDRKSRPKIHCRANNFRLLRKGKKIVLAFHWLCIQAHTMLQQLQKLASDDIIVLVRCRTFFPRIGAWTDVVCWILGRRRFGVKFQIHYQTLALL